MRAASAPLIVLAVLFSLFVTIPHTPSFAAPATHIVISEVKVGDENADDEFVELYNPTDSSINVTNWQIVRKTQSGSEFTLLAQLSGIIPAHGYFLIAHEEYNGTITADITYNNSAVAPNNTLAVKDTSQTIIDKVGMGGARDFEGEAAASSPASGRSIERKAFTDTTSTDMEIGGKHETSGNAEDTDNNDADFILRAASSATDPQNTKTPSEPTTQTTPTQTPTNTPSPTQTPTTTPTSTPTPTAIPSTTPIPTRAPNILTNFTIGKFTHVCTLHYTQRIIRSHTFSIPKITCKRVKNTE